jgi:hypothetical protein
MDPPLKTVPFDSAETLNCVAVFLSKPADTRPAQHVRGPNFVCNYPKAVALGSDGSSQRGSEVHRIGFPIEFPEP